jgi:NAD(P)-dependent dehydrogenase (short-subunit alcohol dehydrogenase family)
MFFHLARVGYACMSLFQSAIARLRAAHAAVSLPGRRAVVVGGTSGIGRAIAARLAAASVSVVVVGRDVGRGTEVVKELMAAATPSAGPPPKHVFVPLDAQSLVACRGFGATYAGCVRTPTVGCWV